MIEEIKKEIKELWCPVDDEVVNRKSVLEILDKYNNQSDYVKVQNGKECYCTERYLDEQYKKAWEELKGLDVWLFFSGECQGDGKIVYLNNTMQELEQKYNLGGNDI